MITGFNTDIEFQGVTYHVQTEDKGVDTPLILSLVYDRGTILASKRSPYDDLLIENFDENLLAERLQKQHKLICAAVKAGRIEDLKRMSMKDSATKKKAYAVEKETKSAAEKIAEKTKDAQPPPFLFKETKSTGSQHEIKAFLDLPSVENDPAASSPKTAENKDFLTVTPPEHAGEPIIEAVQIIEDEIILPADAVEVISDLTAFQPIIDTTLKINLLGDNNFRAGERKTINIAVFRGARENALSDAHIMVKVLGSSFRPLIFHAKTADNGVATVHLQLPQFRSGRAALLIRAMSEGDEAELRRGILQS